ncbi:cupin domain-containing protein [Sediminibacterium soli]|uniref:cupin domain-containing protein n=1 Tax=Sediminibacterium soli TaxID=2698829 RepID=UPI00137AA06D|nr:cupin domain-containing protein [Sediminibacterium soli]NCI47500.1 cupin domain-containing protein [Sediminibacterium soli]
MQNFPTKKSALTVLLACVLAAAATAQKPVASDVYHVTGGPARSAGELAQKLFEGWGAVLSSHTMFAYKLTPQSSRHILGRDGEETFFIVKEGQVTVKLKDSSFSLGTGSVIGLMNADSLAIFNGDQAAEVYAMRYRSDSPDKDRGRNAGGSFAVNWNDIPFKPHNKGGVRQFFDRPTVMLNRFDMHVTTLNPNNKSHDPHTHKNEEVIVMLQGNAEMQIGTEHKKANGGDVVYLGSNVLHNLTNIGTVPCVYYAIQWN